MSKLININKINENELTITKTGKYYNVLEKERKFLIKIKNLITPFGIGDYNGNKKYSMLLNIEEEKIIKKLECIRLRLIEEVVSNSKISKDVNIKVKTEETISMIFNDLYKENKNATKYPGFVKMNFATEYNTGLLKVGVIGEDNKSFGFKHTPETLKEFVGVGSLLDVVFSLNFYIMGGKQMGVSCKVYALRVKKKGVRNNLLGIMLEDSDDEEEEK
jgi:hypothetical protein